MSARDLETAIGWAADEGWNPGEGDAAAFHSADPDGFLMGFVDGRPATSISMVRYGAEFAFLGLYICVPELRGRGLGLATWNAAMVLAGDRTIGLDGVVAQQSNYVKSGFALAHRNVRFAGTVATGKPVDPRVVPVAGSLVPAVTAYDAPAFPAPREAFLSTWLGGGRQALALVEDGAVRGYGVVRRCRSGSKIGPLVADSEDAADILFQALAARGGPGPVHLDLPEPNAAALALARRHGLGPVFETARMYRGRAPILPLDRIYGITTFELG